MKSIGKRIEDVFTEITFAEERIIPVGVTGGRKAETAWDRTFTAITFAEAGEYEKALDFLDTGRWQRRGGTSNTASGSVPFLPAHC